MKNIRDIIGFLQQLGDAVLIVRKNSEIVFANTACHQLFGYRDGTLNGKKLDLLIASPLLPERHAQLVHRFVDSNSDSRNMMAREELYCLHASGEAFSAKISISTFNKGGQSYGVAVIHDFTQVSHTLDTLREASHRDALTGLYNRRYLHELASQYKKPAQDSHRTGVAYLDLDGFKQINDQLGHPVGDQVLTTVAARIAARLRKEDIALRLGGDEFLLFFQLHGDEPAGETLKHILDKLLDAITKPMKIAEHRLRVGVSCGYGVFPQDSNSLTDLIHLTDQAMYRAKLSNQSWYNLVAVEC